MNHLYVIGFVINQNSKKNFFPFTDTFKMLITVIIWLCSFLRQTKEMGKAMPIEDANKTNNCILGQLQGTRGNYIISYPLLVNNLPFVPINILANPLPQSQVLDQLPMPDLPMPHKFISLRRGQHRRCQFPVNIVQPQDILPTPNLPGYI